MFGKINIASLNIYTKILLYIIALIEVVGGITGAYVAIKAFGTIERNASNGLVFLIATLFLILFVLSIIVGMLLFFKKNMSIYFSIFIQLIQIPQFNLFGSLYEFYSDINLSVLFIYDKIGDVSIFRPKFDYGILFSHFLFYISFVAQPKVYIGINLCALILFIFLWKFAKREKLIEKLIMFLDNNQSPNEI